MPKIPEMPERPERPTPEHGLSRRAMLRWGGAAAAVGAASAVGVTLKRAGAAQAQRGAAQRGGAPRLIVVLAGGGVDTTYAIDPKEPAFADVPAGAVRQFAGLDVFCDESRPSVAAYFERHAAVTTIVRGVSTDAINHAECQLRITTGSRESTRPDLGAMVAHETGLALPVPYLILGDVAFTGPYAVNAARVGATNQLIELLDDGAGGGAAAISAGEEALLRQYSEASAARARAMRGALGYNRRRVDDFVEAMQRGEQLRKLKRFGRRGETQSFGAQIDVALEALQQELSQAVMLNTRMVWDTHSENHRQGPMHELMFAELLRLMDELGRRPGRAAGTRMIDDTVVVVLSELGRTPRTYSGGKDHWPVTSAMIMGAGCTGGAVIGATTAGAEAIAMDLATGAPKDVSAGGIKPMYSHLSAGLLQLCGIDPSAYFAVPAFDAFIA
jgi:Protein of unknown function (DUF1501)